MPNSSAPLAKRLMLKPDTRGLVLGAPPGFLDALAPTEGVQLATKPTGTGYAFGMTWVRTAKDLAKEAPRLLDRMDEDAMVWIAWPKKSGSIATDLSRDAGWEALHATGWEGVTLVSLDEDWSAFRVRPSSKVKSTRK